MPNLNCKQILDENLDGLVSFIQTMVIHNGNYKPERLWKVEKTGGELRIRTGYKGENLNDYCVLMGGEVSNSFVALYEMAYFFQALFLSGVGSCVLKKGWLGKYKSVENPDILKQVITSDLLSLDNQTILNNLKAPLIGIVSALDTDVTPIRYNTHHLWRLDPNSFKKYVGRIDNEEYGQSAIDESFRGLYWVEKDRELADKVMSYNLNLPKTKALMMYEVFEKVCQQLDIELSDIPLFFLFSPQEELENVGQDFSFLDVLSAINTQDKKNIYRLLTKQNNPWAISTSCPNCSQSSKTIVYSKILDATSTVRLSCRKRQFSFQNERGDVISDCGCGNIVELEIPRGTKRLYEFIKNNNITIHFPSRSVIFVLRDSSVTPVGIVACDLGLEVGKYGKVVRRNQVPKGYGDHLEMLISSILFQDCILDTKIYDTILGRYLTLKNVYLNHSQQVFCYDRATKLVDQEISNYDYPETKVSDTSVFKYLERGNSAQDLFYNSIRLYPFDLEDAKRLRNLNVGLIEKYASLTY
jgi:hypothetical protein